MDIRFSLIEAVEPKAVWPLARLIHSFLQTHNNVGCIEIGRNEISFTKGFFFSVGKVSYEPYELENRNGTIVFKGSTSPAYTKDDLFVILVNAIRQLKKGYVITL